MSCCDAWVTVNGNDALLLASFRNVVLMLYVWCILVLSSDRSQIYRRGIAVSHASYYVSKQLRDGNWAEISGREVKRAPTLAIYTYHLSISYLACCLVLVVMVHIILVSLCKELIWN